MKPKTTFTENGYTFRIYEYVAIPGLDGPLDDMQDMTYISGHHSKTGPRGKFCVHLLGHNIAEDVLREYVGQIKEAIIGKYNVQETRTQINYA